MRSQHLGTIREFNTRNFRVLVEAEADFDLDLSFDESGDVARKLDNGDLIAFQVAVRVFCKATGAKVGADYLGGCIYESIEAFADHRACGKQNRKWEKQGKAGRCGSYFAGMISEAIAEARKNFAVQRQVLADIRLRAVPVKGGAA